MPHTIPFMKPEQIKQLRTKLGLTQEDFAIRIGLDTRASVSRLESGVRKPKGPLLELLRLMENTLHRNPDEKFW